LCSGIHRGGKYGGAQLVLAFLVGETPAVRDVAGDHLQPGNVCGVAVKLPTHESRDAFRELHAGVLEDPVIRLAADPVGATDNRPRTLRADQRVLWRIEVTVAGEDALGASIASGLELELRGDGVAA